MSDQPTYTCVCQRLARRCAWCHNAEAFGPDLCELMNESLRQQMQLLIQLQMQRPHDS